MRIDSSRYRLFRDNPEEYRLKELWKIVPDGKGQPSFSSHGRRRGTAFHELMDGKNPDDLKYLGESALDTAKSMYEANKQYGHDTTVLWTEQEFDIEVPWSSHRMVGRVDSMVERYGETFLMDYKTTRHRTKADMEDYRTKLRQSPQVDFYLSAHPEASKLVYRILWSKPTKKGPEINISELTCTRTKWELEAFQYSVDMICSTIEFWVEKYGKERPWPRALALPVSPEMYSYRPDVYGRRLYTVEGLEGYSPRVEHLDCLKTPEVNGAL